MGQPLSTAERVAIKEAWKVIKPNAHDISNKTFVELFKHYPHYKIKFPRIADVPEKDLASCRALHCHGLMFSRALTALVENLDDEEMVDEILHRLAHRHSRLEIYRKDLQATGDIFCRIVDNPEPIKVGFQKMNQQIGNYLKELR